MSKNENEYNGKPMNKPVQSIPAGYDSVIPYLIVRNAAKAIEGLQAASAYELGQAPPLMPASMYPVYVRGQVYLKVGQGQQAAAEFQKIVDHPGVVLNFPLGALAHLGLGRAYALAGDKVKARRAYQDFLALWRDADADIPILKQANADYKQLG